MDTETVRWVIGGLLAFDVAVLASGVGYFVNRSNRFERDLHAINARLSRIEGALTGSSGLHID